MNPISVQLYLLLMSIIISVSTGFKFQHINDKLESSSTTANLTMTNQVFEFKLGDSNFQMKPTINLETGLAVVFGTECAKKNQCRKGESPPQFDKKKNKATIVSNNFKYVLNSMEKLTGDILADNFKFGDFSINTTFGYVSSGASTLDFPDMSFGLGFGTEGNAKYIEPIKSIFQNVNQKGVLIKNGMKAGDGTIIIGTLSDPSCLDMLFTDAQRNDKGQQTWWIKVDSITSGKSEETNKTAAFDFTSDTLTLPRSIYKDISTDAVPSLDRLNDIKLEIGEYTLMIKPEEYTIKTEDGKYRPNIMENLVDSPAIKLGGSFYHNRCIVLKEDDGKTYRIGISQRVEKKSLAYGLQVSILLFITAFVVVSF